jgi:hypothetical protein
MEDSKGNRVSGSLRISKHNGRIGRALIDQWFAFEIRNSPVDQPRKRITAIRETEQSMLKQKDSSQTKKMSEEKERREEMNGEDEVDWRYPMEF